MGTRLERLERALSLMDKDDQGWFLHGHFCILHASALVTRDMQLGELSTSLSFLLWDLWNMLTIVVRLDWQRQMYGLGEIDDHTWMAFAGCDIDLFHVEFRSLFDHLLGAVRAISDRPGAIPYSFNRLQTRLKSKPVLRKHLGDDLARIIESCEWFPALAKVRKAIVHRGGFTPVFLESDRILFNIMVGVYPQIFRAEVMSSDRVVDFELYAALYLGYLLAYLEDVARAILDRLGDRPSWKALTGAKCYHSGLRVVCAWIKQLLAKKAHLAT